MQQGSNFPFAAAIVPCWMEYDERLSDQCVCVWLERWWMRGWLDCETPLANGGEKVKPLSEV